MSVNYIEIKNQVDLLSVVTKIESCGFNRISQLEELSFKKIKDNYHGNSKILIKLYFNNILNRKEWRITTKTIEDSYK